MQFEIIGLLATLFVLMSFLMNDIRRVRVINIIGAALFVVYGYLVGAFSTSLLNALLIAVHISFLKKKV